MKKLLSLLTLPFLITSFYFHEISSMQQTNTKSIAKPNLRKKQTPEEKEKPEQKFTEIIFGQTGSFSGSLKTYGEIIKNAIDACFQEANKSGDLGDVKLKLISLDDKGKAQLAAKNIKNLFDENKIYMFLGCTGTRGVLKVLPLIKSGKIAMFFPWGGDPELMQQDLTYQINGLGLIEPQTEKLIDYIVNELKLTKIGIFCSDGDFSQKSANIAIDQLKKVGIKPVQNVNYNRFTMNIKRPSKQLITYDPKVVLSLGTSMPTAKMIEYFFKAGNFGTNFLGIDSTLFVSEILKEKNVNFEYSSCVPDPKNIELPIVKEYQEVLKKYYPEETFNILSLAYYIQAKIIIEAIKKISGPITKEKIISEIENMINFDLGGFKINFDSQTRYAFGKDVIILKG
ncbi:MAG: ABC transporter substrate-binding protein [bacterium]